MATDGILGTPVTWAEFERDLRAALGTHARLGSNKSVLDIGDGNGFVSCCGLITCDWVGATVDENLPATVVLKIPSAEPLRRLNDSLPEGQKMLDDSKLDELAGQLKEIHNTEVASYDFISQFDGHSLPRKYYGKPIKEGEDGHICLAYMENSRTMNFWEKHNVEQLKQIARALGKIQASSLNEEPTAPEFSKNFFEMLSQTWGLETFTGMFKGIFAFDSSEKTKELMNKIDALLPFYHAANMGAKILDKIEFRRVLVNGDLHTGNVLIDKDTGNLTALIDWQCTHLGLGVEDLHRIAMSSLTTTERRAAMPMLIKEMYDSMVEHLDGAEPPYTLEKLLVLSDLVFPPAALFLTGTFTAFISKVDKDPKINDEEREVRKEVMLDKIIGCLEDIVEMNIKNKKHAEKLNITFD